MVDVQYPNRRLEKLFKSEQALVRAYGRELATKIGMRLVELETASVMSEVLDGPGRWEQLVSDRSKWSARLNRNYRLIVSAATHDAESAMVVDVEDYH
ncbi:type II toxin-antitoxin system RelE/ParE family toxin [Promicromonospora sp. Populi]|uniref:type II toxin-antitoxin system RelE/ParE family toxin n=1 Tax=Promicromonospora sp. Populi TaxID=3239420 RepID=UPI0034E2EBA1